jgi:acyl-CoA synthetase (AMP-forming)/AMP-acid ligase II
LLIFKKIVGAQKMDLVSGFEMDWRSGYGSDGIYRSLRTQLHMPKQAELDLVTFLFSGKAGDPQLANTAALVDAETGERLTFGELGVTVRSIAAGLAELGVRQGSTVMILLGNSIFFPVIFMAITSIGAVVTTVNPLNTRYEIAKQMRDSGTRFLITIPQLVSKVEGLESLLGLILLEDPSSSSSSAAAAEVNKNNKLSFTPFSKLLATNPDNAPIVRIRQTDTAALLYSSGTTGASKGVVITHKSFIAAQIIATDGINEFRDLPSQEVVLGLVPFFHVFGLALMGCADLRRGATVVVMSKFGIFEMLETIQKYRVTSLPVVPPIVLALCRPGVMNAYDVSSVANIACGAAPLSKELTERCAAKFPNATINQVGIYLSSSLVSRSLFLSVCAKDRRFATTPLNMDFCACFHVVSRDMD